MARLWTSGFELQSAVNGVEWYNINNVFSDAEISTDTKRSGTASLRIRNLSSGAAKAVNQGRISLTAETSIPNGVGVYARSYIYISTLPSDDNTIMGFSSVDNILNAGRLLLTSGGNLKLVNNTGGGYTVIGTSSTALSTGQWYRIELYQKRHATTPDAGADELGLRINGISEVSTTTAYSDNAVRAFFLGGNLGLEAQTQGEWFFDDVAVNDDRDSNETSWPGEGKVVHLNVNGAGEFAQTITNTTGETNAWEALDEVIPDDDTSYITFTDNATSWSSAGSRGMFAVDNIPETPDSIKLVSVGSRFTNLSASGSRFEIGLQTSNGGTKLTTLLDTIAVSSGWATHQSTTLARPYKLTAYTDPDSAAWTESSLNSLQIGIRATDANPDFYVTKMWALVEYTVSSSTTTTKTQTGIARITATTTKTQTGVANISNTSTQTKTQDGKARIQVTTTKTQTGVARITATTTRTQTGLAKIVLSSGPNSPSTVVNDNTTGTLDWTNPGNATASDDSKATIVISNTTSHYLKATDFGFSIPAGATINGIKAEVECMRTGGNYVDNRVRIVKGGTIGSTEKATLSALPLSDQYVTYGGPTDLWGETWTVSDINASNFGFVYSVWYILSNGLGEEARVDHLRITVYYTPSDATTQTQTGISRIQKSVSQTQLGNARIQVTTARTQDGISRVTRTFTQTQTGLARIQKAVTQTIQGLARIIKTVAQNQTGVGRIQRTEAQTQDGKGRIQVVSTQTQTGVARITVSTSQTQTGVANITALEPVLEPRFGQYYGSGFYGLHYGGVTAPITGLKTKTQTGKARIERTETATQDGLARLQRTETATQQGLARVTAQTTQEQTGLARIEKTAVQTQDGVSRISLVTEQEQTGKARITAVTSQEQTGKAYILGLTLQTQTGVARIEKTTLQTQTGVAHILVAGVSSKTQTGVARIQRTETQTQQGLARVERTATQLQTGHSRIEAVTSQEQTGKARITASTTQTQTGKAAISKTQVQTQTGVARIEVTTTRTQTGIATIANEVNQVITGKARIRPNVGWADKYSTRNTVSNDKYSTRSTSYADKYSTRSTEYIDKY